ncbi:MAG: DsbE family thiol:disulfide interchange protein [Sphingomonadaceae bacterium]|nr:DsbE family thiol:disulfide interchange protein [Sphingomonadaceae bacterium]
MSTQGEGRQKISPMAVWLPLFLFGVFFALVIYGLASPASRDVESAMIGKPLPEFALRPAIADRPGLSSSDLSIGEPRLLNIFASWCIPCAIEAPQLETLNAQGIEVVGIAIRDRPDDVAAFLARNGNPFSRIGADDVSAVQLGIGSSGVPETFVIDGNGIILYQHIGVIRREDLPLIMDKLAEAAR